MNPLSPFPLPSGLHWDWRLQAACRGMDVTDFFLPDFARGPAKTAQEARAKEVCATCPVQRNCLDWALTVNEQFGVWGGTSPEQRKRLGARDTA